jgi:hypothetical protein
MIPPTMEPAIIPAGMINILIWYSLILLKIPRCIPMLMPTKNIRAYKTPSVFFKIRETAGI